jgi:hypothetical protein
MSSTTQKSPGCLAIVGVVVALLFAYAMVGMTVEWFGKRRAVAQYLRDVKIEGNTARFDLALDEMSRESAEDREIRLRQVALGSKPLEKYAEPIARAVFETARKHPNLSRIVIGVKCHRRERAFRDQYGNESTEAARTTTEEPIVVDGEALEETRKYRDLSLYLKNDSLCENIGYALLGRIAPL